MDRTLEKISNVGLHFLAPHSYQYTLELVVKEAAKLTRADWAGLYISRKSSLKEVATYPKGLSLYTPRRRGYTYKSYKERKTFLLHSKQIESVHPELKGEGFRSTIFIPISYHNKSVGALTLVSKKNIKFSRKELKLLKVFGSYAMLAIRKAQLSDEAKRSLDVRDLFISMAAHELRTPLTTISGYIQLLHRKLTVKNSPETKWTGQLLAETKRFTFLVNELLEINRIKTGNFQYNFKECDINEILDRAINSFTFNHPSRKLIIGNSLKYKERIVVGDFDKLLQVILNILDNAAKFSSNNSLITISLKRSREKYIALTIQDKGKGIDPKDIPYLFQEFYKGDKQEEGIGLGLFLARNIIKKHRGDIGISSEFNKGTEVEIKLPIKKGDKYDKT